MIEKYGYRCVLVCLIIALALSVSPVGMAASSRPKAPSSGQANSAEGLGQECTSWVATGSATAGGHTLLSKNRDKARQQEMVVYKPKTSSTNAYLAVTKDPNTDDVGAGINEYGLAVSCNVGYWVNLSGGLAPVSMNREILEKCSSVNAAYSYISSNKNRLYNEAIFCLADKTKAAIVEVKSVYSTSMTIKPLEQCLVDGVSGRPTYGGRSNCYQQFSNWSTPSDHDRRRYERVMNFLSTNNGSLSPLYCFVLSRDHYYVDTKDDDHDGNYTELLYTDAVGAICNQSTSSLISPTISGVTFDIDPQYVELSTMWLAIGAPDSTLYVPIHLGMFKSSSPSAWLPYYWTSSSAYNDSETIRSKGWWKESTFNGCLLTFIVYESKMYNADTTARANARTQLNAGNLTGALATLKTFDTTAANSVQNNIIRVKNETTAPPWGNLTWP